VKYNPRIVVAYFQECGLPTPMIEHAFHPDRKWRFDFAWKCLSQLDGMTIVKLALEVQGGAFVGGAHVRGAALRKEHEKRNEAAALGWRMLYCFPEELCKAKTVDVIRRTLRY